MRLLSQQPPPPLSPSSPDPLPSLPRPALPPIPTTPPPPQAEDIVDSGRTATALLQHYRDAGAASCKLVSLLSKPSRREVPLEPDYLCFEVEDKFVVGYGLDFDELYRTLPYVGVLRPECYGRVGGAEH